MRRFIPLGLIGPVLFATSLHAAEPAVSWGLKAGVNVSDAALSPDLPAGVTKSSRTGFVGGAFGEARLSDPLSVQLEVLYTRKGFDLKGNGQSLEYKADYLELPLTLKATFGSDAFRPYVFAGPNLGIRRRDRREEGHRRRLSRPNTSDLRPQWAKSTDFAVDMGAGFLYRLKPGAFLLLDARYSLGLVNVVNGSMGGDSAKTRDVKVLTGVRFAVR